MSEQHRIAVLRQVSNALRKTFDTDYPEDRFKDVFVGPEFQMAREKYPAVYVAYQESSIQSAGLGHYIETVDTDGIDRVLRQAIAQGAVQFTVMALTPFERDALLDSVSDLLLFSKYGQAAKHTFWKEIHDADFVWMTMNSETVQPGGVGTLNVPWEAENELFFTGSYSVNVETEFFSDYYTSEFVPINRVNVFPYRPDQAVPTGSNDPAPWN